MKAIGIGSRVLVDSEQHIVIKRHGNNVFVRCVPIKVSYWVPMDKIQPISELRFVITEVVA